MRRGLRVISVAVVLKELNSIIASLDRHLVLRTSLQKGGFFLLNHFSLLPGQLPELPRLRSGLFLAAFGVREVFGHIYDLRQQIRNEGFRGIFGQLVLLDQLGHGLGLVGRVDLVEVTFRADVLRNLVEQRGDHADVFFVVHLQQRGDALAESRGLQLGVRGVGVPGRGPARGRWRV
jgi:hypothetical protein